MRELKIKPEIGKLYRFREDNRDLLIKKYSFYYSGLLMCIQVDVENIKSEPLTVQQYTSDCNLLYQFEVYKCIQHFAQSDFFEEREEYIYIPLYLTLYEINDMIEEAYGKCT